MKVLIVDDEDIVINILKVPLKNLPFIEEIMTANTIKEALHILDTNRPDIVFLDLSLDIANDGFEVLKSIKRRFPKIAVSILSGDIHISTVRKALSLGAEAYIKKPFSNKQIEKITLKLSQMY